MHPYFDPDGPPLAISHAGDTDHGDPGGSVTAYQRAADVGFRWFQVDVVAIGHGDLASAHAVTGRKRRWESMSIAEVSEATGHPVPTLAQLLDGFPGAHWNIEVKSRAVLDGLLPLLRRPGVLDRVCVSAPFHRGIVRRLRSEFGDAICLCAPLVDGGLFGFPLWPFRRTRADAVQVWWPLLRSRRLVARVRSRGLGVQVWTVNTPTRADRLLDWDVTGLITDRHEMLRDVHAARGWWAVDDS